MLVAPVCRPRRAASCARAPSPAPPASASQLDGPSFSRDRGVGAPCPMLAPPRLESAVLAAKAAESDRTQDRGLLRHSRSSHALLGLRCTQLWLLQRCSSACGRLSLLDTGRARRLISAAGYPTPNRAAWGATASSPRASENAVRERVRRCRRSGLEACGPGSCACARSPRAEVNLRRSRGARSPLGRCFR